MPSLRGNTEDECPVTPEEQQQQQPEIKPELEHPKIYGEEDHNEEKNEENNEEPQKTEKKQQQQIRTRPVRTVPFRAPPGSSGLSGGDIAMRPLMREPRVMRDLDVKGDYDQTELIVRDYRSYYNII